MKKALNVEMIEKLTKDQEAKIPEYLERYMNVGLSTTPCNRQKAEDAITASYVYNKMNPPKFMWVDSPQKGLVLAAKIANNTDAPTNANIRDQISKASYGSFEAYWVTFYVFIAEQLPVKKDNLYQIAKDIVENCGVYWTFDSKDGGIVVISEKPTAIHMKDGKLNNPDGLALEYKDGSGVFAIDGVRKESLIAVAIESSKY